MYNNSKYLKTERLPFIWCGGCSNFILTDTLVRSINACNLDQNKTVIVSGIGCSGRMSSYMNFDSIHTTHGRTLTFATGIKMANPDLNVIVISGDGDGLAIGGNHFIHSCRRNIDITTLIINNSVYGMTGGQSSPMTPYDFYTTTSPYGYNEPPFDIVELAIAAGATFVARETIVNDKKTEELISNGIRHKGFSVIECVGYCHTTLGRKNKMPKASDMANWIKSRCIEKKLKTGLIYQDKSKKEFSNSYFEMVKNAKI